MRVKSIMLSLLACFALAASSQPTQQTPEWEWYLDEVISETFVGRNYFEYYYSPSAADMKQQREQGEVNYFLNTPEGLNSKKVRDMIDRLMASYDDIQAVGDWHVTTNTYWKEFRYEKNKFRFSVKRKALDDGTYYVSVTETAGYFKSLGKKNSQKPESATRSSADQPTARHSKRDRKPVVVADNEVDRSMEDIAVDEVAVDDVEIPRQASTLSAKEQRKLENERREAERRELRAKQRREQEQRREEAKAQKEAEKVKKAEEKKQRQEEERLKKEEKRREQEQKRELQRKEREARQQSASAAKKQQSNSRYHYTDVALWLSEKYDFTQTAMSGNGCTMYSTVVKDVEMAKLAIKNALKGSNARMAVPWRLNSGTQAVETGYTVDDHILVFAIGKDDEGQITLNITEVSNDEFELFKSGN